jgi:DNA mismatch repair protein MutS2
MTPKSLVLLDELGAGTDPAEGSALAIALLEYIHSMGCRIIATTHYSELKAYAYERKGVINASMEFDIQTLSPTYRLMIGVPGRSNAFAIAERLGLPKPIIERARGEVGEEDQKVETMIASLEANRLGAEAERATAEQLRREVEQLRTELADQKSRFAEQKDKLLAKAEQDARMAVDKARKEADTIISELRKLAMEEKTSVKEHKLIEAKRRLEEAVPKLGREKQGASARSGKEAARLEPGDEVHVVSLNQKGHVVELAGTKEVVVQMGIMKMKLSLQDVEPLAKSKPKIQQTATTVKRTKDDSIRMELDLRGSNLEEALIEVDRFLDEAFLANLGQVYIIHGKGTGVLRTGIQEYLRRHKNIKQYRLGAYGEGGAGVTVVELK